MVNLLMYLGGIILKKGISIGIIFLIVGMCIIPSICGTTDVKQSATSTSDGNTLYVGGSGPDNYTKIQHAINYANDGDTVFVYDDSSPYYENIIIDKSINLVGEEKNTTIIDGKGGGKTVETDADGITIAVFTIQHGGIYIRSNNNYILGNIISHSSKGILIEVWGSHNWSSHNMVKGNRIVHNSYGICIFDYDKNCKNNTFTENFIAHNRYYGIFDDDRVDGGVIATWNVIADNGNYNNYYWYQGVFKHDSNSVYHHNDFFFNPQNAVVNGGRYGNDWDDGSEGNYWDDWEDNPGYPDYYRIQSSLSEEIDWHPSANRWTNALVVDGYSSIGYRIIYILVNDTIDFYCRARGGVSPYSFHWDFGDGNTSDVKNPTHTFVSPGIYEVTITIIDNDSNIDMDIAAIVNVGTGPPYAPTIDGPISGKINVWHLYEFLAVDPDGNDVYYTIDWGNGIWYEDIGPYESGEKVYCEFFWSEPGNYTIRACARDGTGLYGHWETLKVTMPKNKPFDFNYPLLNWLFERFPNMFPILRHLQEL